MPGTDEKPKKASGAEKRKRRRETLAQQASEAVAPSVASTAAPSKVTPVSCADMVDTPLKPTAGKPSAPQQAQRAEAGNTEESLEDMKFGKLVRLAKEQHGLTDEQLDDMEQPDLVTWVRAKQSKSASADVTKSSSQPTDEAGREKRRKLSGSDKRKQKKAERAVVEVCKGGPKKELTAFSVGLKYPGTVVSIKEMGAYIDIGAERDGFCHVSRLADGFVKNPKGLFTIGQTVEAKVIDVMLKKNKITLSLQTDDMQAREEQAMQRFRSPSAKKGSNKKSPAKQAARNERRLAAKAAGGLPDTPAKVAPKVEAKVTTSTTEATVPKGDAPKKASGAEKRKRRQEKQLADAQSAVQTAEIAAQPVAQSPQAAADGTPKKLSGAEKRKRRKEAALLAASQ